MAWLRQGIQTHKLIINDAKALVHNVAGTAYLVSPGVFQRYAQEHLQIAALAKPENLEGWQWVQKRFEKLGLHRKQASGLNIWTCEVTGPRKSRRLHGYLLSAPSVFQEMPPDNPYLRLLTEAVKREIQPPVIRTTTNGVDKGPRREPASVRGLGRSRLCQLGFSQRHQVGRTAFQRTGDFENEGSVGTCSPRSIFPMCERSIPDR